MTQDHTEGKIVTEKIHPPIVLLNVNQVLAHKNDLRPRPKTGQIQCSKMTEEQNRHLLNEGGMILQAQILGIRIRIHLQPMHRDKVEEEDEIHLQSSNVKKW